MKINFLDLKEFNPLKFPEILTAAEAAAAPILTEYVIKEMFNLHAQVSRTVWNIRMFDEEFNREGSGFLICYMDGGKAIAVPKFTILDIDENLKLDLQSIIAGFFIFYNVLDEIHILDVAVAKELQSKGLGSLMLYRIIRSNAKRGIRYYFLEVRASNKIAINLYKKFGFKIFMIRKNYYDDGEDALCMAKEL